jgi:hypothetical protein
MLVKIMVKEYVKGVDGMILCLITKQPVQPDLLIYTLKLNSYVSYPSSIPMV